MRIIQVTKKEASFKKQVGRGFRKYNRKIKEVWTIVLIIDQNKNPVHRVCFYYHVIVGNNIVYKEDIYLTAKIIEDHGGVVMVQLLDAPHYGTMLWMIKDNNNKIFLEMNIEIGEMEDLENNG